MRRNILLLSCLLAATLSLLSAARAFAQAPGEVQKRWGVYWISKLGFTSSLEMKNNLFTDPLAVTIWVYIPGGEFILKTVTLAPRETTVLDLNSAIQSSLIPHDANEGALEVQFVGPNPSALMGSISITNLRRGTAWNFFLYPRRIDPEATAAPLQSVFWLPGEDADGFVAGQNVSESNLVLTPIFEVQARDYPLPAILLRPDQGFKLDLRNELRKLGLAHVTAGGVKLVYQGDPDALKAHGALFDEEGFSSEMDFLRYEAADTLELYFRTPRFAVGMADRKLGLPTGTIFKPTLVLHNFGAQSLSPKISIGVPRGSGMDEVNIPVVIAPGRTEVLPLSAQLAGAITPDTSWASVQISYSADSNDLAAALVSVSQDGEHSLRSVLNWVEGNDREGWYWQADTTHDTFINLLNTDTEPAQVQISLDYTTDGQQRTYQLPDQTLAPKASSSVDVGQIIAAGEPDAQGNVIPPSVNYGGYRVRKVGPHLGATLTTEALLFDHQRKSFVSIYNTCCGLNGPPSFSPGSFLGPVGPIGNFLLQGQDYCSGQTVNLTSSGTYSSANTAIARVGSTGNVAGVSGGSTNSNASLKYYQQRTVDTCLLKSGSSQPAINVQVPTRVEPIGPPVSNSGIVCSQGQGWAKVVTNQLQDQWGNGYKHAGILMADVISFGSTNQLQLSPGPGFATTDANGSWTPDFYTDCTSKCPSSGESDALQTWTYNGIGLPHSNLVIYKCTSITIDGH
jgi:hypothetical protein